jgi:anti-sigma regulatory factor (Ser/Thr protein kinase)
MATLLAQRLGFGESECGKVALVVTEAATNLIKHAGGGELLLRPLERGGVQGLEVLALDKGPGMAAVDECLRDGFSTAGSRGNGLGAIARLAALFEIHSLPHVGTALLAHLWAEAAPADPPAVWLEIGVVNLPKLGEAACGDTWTVQQEPGRSLFLVADGLGHGLQAADAAREAVRVVRAHAQFGPAELLPLLHGALRSTRGAAVALAEVQWEARAVRFVGVGNVAGTIFADGSSRSMVSHNGTVGCEVRKIQEFVYPFPRGAILVMHSDGLGSQWRLDQYAGLAARHPALVAGVLYREFKRGRDDVTVLAAREATRDGA